jgi:hypothetical protein
VWAHVGGGTSFIEGFWDDMYLNGTYEDVVMGRATLLLTAAEVGEDHVGRWSLPINSNPFLLLQADPKRTPPLDRAARMTVAAVRYGHRALTGTLGPIHAGKQRMDEYQFSRMFAATRLPERGRDRLVARPAADAATHPYVPLRQPTQVDPQGECVAWVTARVAYLVSFSLGTGL